MADKRSLLRIGIILIVLLAPGCYTYQEVGLEGVAPGMDVRVNLSREAVLDLEEPLGGFRQVLDGRVHEAGEESLMLIIQEASPRVGFGSTELRQRLRLRHDELLRVEVKELDRRRTAGFLGAVGAIGALILYRVISGGDVGGFTGPGGPGGGEV